MIGEMQMIRVLVVDDMQPICRRYEKLINQEEDMEVVGHFVELWYLVSR